MSVNLKSTLRSNDHTKLPPIGGRNSSLVNAGLSTIQETPTYLKESARSNLRRDPTDAEIEAFQCQLNVHSIKQLAETFKNVATSLKQRCNYQNFQKYLNENFNHNKPAENLVLAMFERFRPFRLEGTKDDC